MTYAIPTKDFGHFKRLTQWLIISVALNIFCLALLFYFISKESPPKPYCESRPAQPKEQMPPLAINKTNEEILFQYRLLSREDLIAELANKEFIENGYAKRDLALTALLFFHHFDLARALRCPLSSLQERKISIGKERSGKSVQATVFSGLTEEQYQAILQFAKTEKWPLTSRGLFFALRKVGYQTDASLADAFFFTEEFEAAHLLFTRSDIQLDKKELLQVILEGSWRQIQLFVSQQKIVHDLSAARRQRFLLDYIHAGSQAAAYLILKTDASFAAKKLDDPHVIQILKLLTKKTEEAEQFASDLLVSPRGDQVWQLAAEKRYTFAGEAIPEADLHHAALVRFVLKKPLLEEKKNDKTPSKIAPKTKKTEIRKSIEKIDKTEKKSDKKSVSTKGDKDKASVKPAVKPAPKLRTYIVKEGDSLWKIAKRFNVTVKDLKKMNRLNSDALKPGTQLVIP